MQEANFNDIRRNYILSSTLLILFLIYWWRIEIHRVLLFDLSWNWYIISTFWDIFIGLMIFFLYTFFRYLIYWYEFINNNKYQYIVLYSILENVIIKSWQDFSKNNYVKSAKIINLQENSNNKSWMIKNLQVSSLNNRKSMHIIINYDNFKFDNWEVVEKQNIWSIPNFYNIFDLIIWSNKILFKYVELSISWEEKIEIEFNSKSIKREFWPKFYNIILKKEYSDFIWPLLLVFVIWIIIVCKIISYIMINFN
jgi:hypothetical protein